MQKITVDYNLLFKVILEDIKMRHEDENTARHVADAYIHGFENILNLPGVAEYVQKLLQDAK